MADMIRIMSRENSLRETTGPGFFIRQGVGLCVNGAGILTMLAAQVLFARLLGVEQYGVMGLVLAVMFLLTSMADFGLGAALPRFVAVYLGEGRSDQIRPLAWRTGTFLAGAAFAVAGILFLLAPVLSRWFSSPAFESALYSLLPFIPAVYVRQWGTGILKGLGHNNAQIFIESLLTPVLILVLGYVFYTAQPEIISVLAGYGVAYALAAALALALALPHVLRFPAGCSGVSLSGLIRHGLPVTFAKMGQHLLKRGDVLALGLFLGSGAVGLYQPAFTLANGVRKGLGPIQSFATHYISKSTGAKQGKAVKNYYTAATLFGMVLALPIYAFLAVFAEPVLGFLFGADYAGAASAVRILCLGFSFYVFLGPVSVLYNALDQNARLMKTVLGTAGGNLLLNIFLIPLMGIEGAAWATSLSIFLNYLMLSAFARARMAMLQPQEAA